MTVNDNTTDVKGSGKLFKTLWPNSAEAEKKLATNEVKIPEKTLQKGRKCGSEAVSRNPKKAFSTILDVVFFLSYR